MTEHKPWSWEAVGHGPDWLFLAQVAPASEEGLAQRVAAAAPRGYRPIESQPAYCEQHGQICAQQMFIDAANAQAYIDNLRGDDPRNIWIYNAIYVHRGQIMIECGYGGRGEAYNEVETAFLLDVLAAPEVTLHTWSVLAGGSGYDYRALHAGEGLEQLRAYLA